MTDVLDTNWVSLDSTKDTEWSCTYGDWLGCELDPSYWDDLYDVAALVYGDDA